MKNQGSIAIVGGGITGLLAAYLLKDSGKHVIIFEKDRIGAGATAKSTAFLVEIVETEARELVKTRGQEAARHILASHRAAIGGIERILKDEQVDAAFTRVPLYLLAQSESDAEDLVAEAGYLRTLGVEAQYDPEAIQQLAARGALVVTQQAKVRPKALLDGLGERVQAAGIEIREHTEFTEDMIPLFEKALLATHYPPFQSPALFFKKAAYVSYVLTATLRTGSLPEALFEDRRVPYHYARVDGDTLMLGGEDHREDIPVPAEKNFAALERHLRKHFPMAGEVTARWKGPIVESGDGLALLGPIDRPNMFYATAYRGTGITYAYIAATLFRDFVLGQEHPWAKLYAANRTFSLTAYLPSAFHYLEEFFGGAVKNELSF